MRSHRSQRSSDVVSTKAIFCFNTGAGHMSLFLTLPRNQRRTKKKAITSGGLAISGISCLISIRKCTENKRKLSKVKKAMEESALQVSKNAQKSSIMS